MDEQEDDNVYSVPPVRSRDDVVPPLQIVPQEECERSPPPVLLPKRGNNSVRVKSIVLDPQTTGLMPRPAPRMSSRKASVDSSLSDSTEGGATPELKSTSNTFFSKSLDVAASPLDDVFSSPTLGAEAKFATPVPQQRRSSRGSLVKDSPAEVVSAASVSTSSAPSAGPMSPPSASVKSPPIAAPRPVPRPRTKVSSSNLHKNVLETISSDNLSSSLPDSVGGVGKSASDNTLQSSQSFNNHPQPRTIRQNSNKSWDTRYSLPPDPDSIESMLDEEIQKKYGALTNMEPLANQEAENGSDNEEGDVYISADTVLNLAPANSRPRPPKPHGAPPPPPKPHGISSEAPSYLPMVSKHRPAGEKPAVAPQPPQRAQESLNELNLFQNSDSKFNIGSDLLSESSTDEINNGQDDGSLFQNPSTPRPFDPQPFKTALSNILPSQASDESEDAVKSVAQAFDFRDIDPLWEDKTKDEKAVIKTSKTAVEELGSMSNEFPVDWDQAFKNPAETDETIIDTQNTYAEPDDLSYPYSKPHRKSPPTPPKKPLPSSESFHYEPPMAPPPPFPREQNRIPEPRPPPVPPRPTAAATAAGTSSHGSPANLPLEIPTHSESVSSNIFNELPTPVFSGDPLMDPFQDSGFGDVCRNFNQTQQETTQSNPKPIPPIPILPASSSPVPKLPVSSSPAAEPCRDTTYEFAAALPTEEFGPERISRFVIPPPGAEAQELSDSTDSECVEEQPEGGMGWIGHVGLPIVAPDSVISPRKNTRYGYLYKQGGYKANKGWKKRWVVFNGTSLSYYVNNTSQVSKRVIPVSCMTDVESDIKQNDKNSFKFKVVTTLKNRVFVFSAENLEDCLTWASVLMAAITEHKRSEINEGTQVERPDREGFIKFGTGVKHYVAIWGAMLKYFHSFEDFQMNSPVHEIDMKVASVKVHDRKKFKLQLRTHYKFFDLTFESDREMQQWRMAMEDAIAEGLGDNTVVEKVYHNLSNKQCADCNADNPDWASINLGIVLCKNCAGIHRMFDYRVSKIRSLRMDTRVWTPSLTELLIIVGNANSNTFWEHRLPPNLKLKPTDTMDKRKEIITAKYLKKKFCDLHPIASMGATALGEELLNTATRDNVLETLKVLFSGADVVSRRDGHGETAYDLAKENGHRLVMELLYQNGGDPQSQSGTSDDENRLREDVRLQGFLNKTGPVGRTFERRWCVLEHGALTYYLNEKSVTSKGSVDRKDMYMIQEVITDRIGYQFDLSTSIRENRLFTFSSDCKDDAGEWVRTIAKLMAPVAVMEHVGMIDIKFAGYAHMKESLVDEWHESFLVFSWRGLNFMNTDLKFDYLDLRKASSIKMQDSSNGFQKKGPCFVIGTTRRSLYIQAPLTRDTEKMFVALRDGVTGSGSTLNDQALTQNNVPVIVDKCLTHIYMMGLDEKGIYRNSAQQTRIRALLDQFKKDAGSVTLTDYTVHEVANGLKRFLRELDDSVFERINYTSWINMAGCKDEKNRLAWYKYYIDKMPLVNYHTLKRVLLHLLTVSQREGENMMGITNLATCFAPSLLRTENDQPNLMSDITSKEIAIIVDLLRNTNYFFQIDDEQLAIEGKINKAAAEIEEIMKGKRQSMTPSIQSTLCEFFILSREGQSINIQVTEDMTAEGAVNYVKRKNAIPEMGKCVLHELLFKGDLERPLFPEDKLLETLNLWGEWEDWVRQDNSCCLCVRDDEMLEKLDASYSASTMLSARLQYAECKAKSKFKKYHVEFKQYRLVISSSPKSSSEVAGWNVEDITIYIGHQPKKSTPTRYCITFLVKGEKTRDKGKDVFGHCLCFDSEEELYRWAACLYVAQYPTGLFSWNR